jgi:DNA-binding IclR family transcriptional regulator
MPANGNTTLMEVLSKRSMVKVLTVLVENPQRQFTNTELVEESGIGWTTLYRILDDLKSLDIFEECPHGGIKLHKLNQNSRLVQEFEDFKSLCARKIRERDSFSLE